MNEKGGNHREFSNWSPVQTITFSPEGKHIIHFSEAFPLELHFYHFSINQHLIPNYHDYLEIGYVYEGNGKFYVESKEYNLNEGDVFVIGNTEFHRVETDYPHTLKIIGLFFLPELVYNVGGNVLDFEYLRPFYVHSVEFVHKIPPDSLLNSTILGLIKKIHAELRERKKYYRLAVKSCLTEMLFLIVRYYKKFTSDLIVYNQKQYAIERLKNTFSFLQHHYQDRINLNRVANLACMSRSYFCKFFKKVTGGTLTSYVYRLRIDKAKELLLIGDLTITEVAYEVGFENHSYFNRVFRRYTKLSPKEYRHQAIGVGLSLSGQTVS